MREDDDAVPELPSWLPANMRCTATPTERMQALMSTLNMLARKKERVKLGIRAKKIQHLCLQIKPGMQAHVPAGGLRERQLLEIFSVGAAFLGSPGHRATPNDAVLSCIYACATLLAKTARQSPVQYGSVARPHS